MIDRAHVRRILARLPEIEQALSQPGAAADQNRYRRLLVEHAALKKVERQAEAVLDMQRRLDENRPLVDDSDAELADLARGEVHEIEAALPAAERALMVALLPPDPAAGRSALLEIRAGTGGDEAALFAADLFRMYSRFADARRWKVRTIDASPSELGGLKDVVCAVEGADAYDWMQYESGVHRVQRVPATEAQGRIHTSAATVAVFPEADAQDDIVVKPEELRVDTYRASGAGGQHVNRTDSAIRITHLPTGLVVQCQDEKSQHRNRERAMSVLKARLLDRQRSEEAERMGDRRRSLIKSGDRSDRIRTYNFPQNRLTDHRIGLTLYSLDRIIEGDLDALVTALRDHDIEQRLQAETARMAAS
jgi:peptide chain release factor 1